MKDPTPIRITKEETPMKLARFGDLTERMDNFYNQLVRRVFDVFEDNGKLLPRDFDHWLKSETEMFRLVKVELNETDEMFTVKAEVPGFAPKELEINAEPSRLTITGKKELKEEKKTEKTIYTEMKTNEIFRVIDLPVDIDTSKVTSTLKDGVLELKLPKAATARKVRVELKAA